MQLISVNMRREPWRWLMTRPHWRQVAHTWKWMLLPAILENQNKVQKNPSTKCTLQLILNPKHNSCFNIDPCGQNSIIWMRTEIWNIITFITLPANNWCTEKCFQWALVTDRLLWRNRSRSLLGYSLLLCGGGSCSTATIYLSKWNTKLWQTHVWSHAWI